jgi:chorismate mutase
MSDINQLRTRIEEVTLEMIKMLKIRMDISKEIGEIKKNTGKGITDENREDNLRAKVITTCNELHLEESIATKFLNFLLTLDFFNTRYLSLIIFNFLLIHPLHFNLSSYSQSWPFPNRLLYDVRIYHRIYHICRRVRAPCLCPFVERLWSFEAFEYSLHPNIFRFLMEFH